MMIWTCCSHWTFLPCDVNSCPSTVWEKRPQIRSFSMPATNPSSLSMPIHAALSAGSAWPQPIIAMRLFSLFSWRSYLMKKRFSTNIMHYWFAMEKRHVERFLSAAAAVWYPSALFQSCRIEGRETDTAEGWFSFAFEGELRI